MFRRLPNKLPPDPSFPADLAKLGYFINDKDQIRQIANPDQKYQYKINRNDRVNDVYREAMNTCTRQEVMKRLYDLGLEELRLPLGASKTDKHVSILVSPDLATKRHIVVFFPERHIDLGILAYRVIGEEGLNAGSIVNFVKSLVNEPNASAAAVSSTEGAEPDGKVQVQADRPGLVIANTSQLIWYRGGGRAVTDREWMYLPRESAVHEPMRIDEVKNRIQGNKDFKEHVHYIFEHILSAEEGHLQICNPQAKISVIGQEYPGSEALQYIVSNWMGWRNRMNCVALVNPQHNLNDLFSDFDFTAPGDVAEWDAITNFIAKRTRAYRLHQKPLEAPISGRSQLGCNVYSAGETLYEESCFVRCWPSILDWIDLCRFSDTYEEPKFDIDFSDDEVNKSDKPKFRSPRKAQTDEQAATTRFHGDLEVTENGSATKID